MTKVKGLNLCNATCGVGRRMAKTVAPEKVSRLDREFLENGSVKSRKLFTAIFFLFLLGVGNVWGAADYTYTLASGDFTTTVHAKTSGTITWTASDFSGTQSYGWDNNYGFKFGSGNSSYPTAFKLTSSSFSNKIKKVVVTANVNSSKSCNLSVKVGSTTYGSQATINTKNHDTKEFSIADASTVNGAVELSFSSNTGPLYLEKIEVYYHSASPQPTLSSIQVSGTPSKKTYEQGETFDPAGLVVTAYYDDETDDNVTEDVEWSFDPATFTVVGSNKPVTVTATYEDKEDSETYDDITVTEHVVTPGEYAISLNNVLYGTTAGVNITDPSVSATKNDITIVSGATSGTKPRTDAACIRYYQNNYLTFSVPTGYQITSIVFAEPSADKTWNGSIFVDEGTYTNSSKSWEGETNSVTFSFNAQNRIATATVTYEATCTELGSINGSVNLSTSSTGTSVSVSVLTEGVNAYGDAANVSGYEFKLYTAASGGSASASYSTNSSAGTSHEFTGLTPLTDYWVTVRPIGDGSTYCNTTAESDRVQIATTCVAPNHVDISGRWDRFGGETISLTATAYSSAGTSSPIDAEDITGYQWQKLISSTWTDVSDGTTDGVTTSGATTNNLQISNCKLNNSGKYRCIVSTGATCSTVSATATDGTEGFDVKVYVLECYTGGTTVYNFTRVGDTQAGTAQITLAAGIHTFKFHADNLYYGNDGTINEDVTNWVCSTSQGNLTIAAGLGGTFTISMEYSTSGSSSVEGEPEISVTYPRKTIYLTPGVWNTDEAKFAFYYFRKVGETIYGEGFTDFITADDCGSYADIPQWNGVKINAVRLNSSTTASDLTNSANHYKAAWDKKWNQTSDITISSNNSITITDWGNGDSPYEYGTYAVPTYTISYAKGSTTYTGGNTISGSKDSETKTCGVDFTLPSSAVFTTTGYTQTGWATSDGGSQAYALGGDYTTNAAQAFYPVWTANNHSLTWSANGGDALTGDYTYGTVAYGTAITAPNTPTRTGYSFDGWHNGTSIVTPATTMPDNDLTYTAQWSLATYTVTLNTNGGTINAGDVDEYTYGTGATLPTNVTRDGYRFDGWFTDDGVWSDQVTAISTTATGDKTYYAKWTQVYTVTWYVNGDEWSSGVVTGNTQVPSGTKVSALPTAPTSSDCDDSKVFVGWKAAEIDGVSVSDPGGIFTTQGTSPTINANMDFYAVFADESGGDNTLVTNVSELTAGTKVYIYAATSDVPAFTGVAKAYDSEVSANNVRAVSGSVSSNKLTPSDGACAYTIGEVTVSATKYYTFNDGTNYLRATGANNNYLVGAAELGDDEKGLFSISISAGVFSITCKNTTVRGVMQFNKNADTGDYSKALFACYSSASQTNVQLFKKTPYTYSNYVTSCASCDADATYTNTTPTVSEIGCTTATLTMEDGLATLGAAGCNISDYGFVIGTSDNPAIGGSGVTKLQVGTTNPTTGEDFSYDATDLSEGTHYYIRAYAINRHGTAYSSSQNFWTKNVSSIAITTAPTKTNYIVGETFDATGMVVTATMASGATEDVTSDVTYSSSALTAGTSQNFAINYSLCETAKSVNQVINVYTLTVNEGTNPSYGTATNSSANIVSITGLGEHKTYTVTVTSSNATAVDNGDNTWSIINATGNVTVTVDYADAVQVKVYYKVDGVTVTGLTQDVYQSETTTLPTASELATAMTAQAMDLPDDTYPNFVGWSETEFSSQTSEPTLVTGTPVINAEKTYYAVYTNLSKITIIPSDFSTSYPSPGSLDGTKTIGGKRFGWNYLLNGNESKTNLPLQFKKNTTEYGRLYNTDPLNYILRVEIGYYNSYSNVPVYVASSAGTISGDALTPASRGSSDPYVYTMPTSTSYFYIKGDNSTTYKIRSVDIYYASATVEYMTQFCTRYTITGASTSGTAVTGGTLTSSYNSLCSGKSLTLSAAVTDGYAFEGWTVTGATSGDLTSSLLGANASSVTPPAFTMPAENLTVSATITEKKVTGWTFTNHVTSAEITSDPIVVYVNQKVQLDIAYSPEPLLSTHKENTQYAHTRADGDTYIKNPIKAGTYFTFEGKASTNGNPTSITLTHNDDSNPAVFAQTVNIEVRALPKDQFLDLVHGVAFDDQAATLTTSEGVANGGVVFTYTAPGSDREEWSSSYANTCEQTKVKLVGWVESEYADACIAADSFPTTDALKEDIKHFFVVGATMTASNKTYYAVWAEIE